MSRQDNVPPNVDKPGYTTATKESSFAANNSNGQPSLYPNLNPPSYSQATYAAIPNGSQPAPAAQPTGGSPAPPPQYAVPNGAVYMAPPTQNIVVVQGPSAYYANPRAQPLPDGSTHCVQCGSVYPLPRGATSFRCRQCGKFNNTRGDQCIIL